LDLDAQATVAVSLEGGVNIEGGTGQQVTAQNGTINGCVDVSGGFSVNAGAEGSFFAFFNAQTCATLLQEFRSFPGISLAKWMYDLQLILTASFRNVSVLRRHLHRVRLQARFQLHRTRSAAAQSASGSDTSVASATGLDSSTASVAAPSVASDSAAGSSAVSTGVPAASPSAGLSRRAARRDPEKHSWTHLRNFQ
jgi:hypothetical protein